MQVTKKAMLLSQRRVASTASLIVMLRLAIALPLRFTVGLVVQDGPVKHKVVLVALSEEQILQKPAEVGVVGAVLEAQTATIVQIGHELAWEVLTEDLDWRRHLLLHDLLVFLLFGVGLEALPRQTSTIEIHEDIANCFKIVPPALLNAQVRVDTSITRSACQILVLTVRDVLLRLRVTVLLGEPEVDGMDLVRLFAQPDQKVVRLDIAMDEVLGVHILYAIDHLICQHQNRLQGEFPIAETKQILK